MVINVPGQPIDQTLDECASFVIAGRNRAAADTGHGF